MTQKLLKLVILVSLFGGLLIGNGTEHAYASNMVANPGFEDGLWAPQSITLSGRRIIRGNGLYLN